LSVHVYAFKHLCMHVAPQCGHWAWGLGTCAYMHAGFWPDVGCPKPPVVWQPNHGCGNKAGGVAGGPFVGCLCKKIGCAVGAGRAKPTIRLRQRWRPWQAGPATNGLAVTTTGMSLQPHCSCCDTLPYPMPAKRCHVYVDKITISVQQSWTLNMTLNDTTTHTK
jgi:hypothetical protein